MAKKKRGMQNTGDVKTNTFIKGLNKDYDPSFISEGQWTHARNAVNNTSEGDLGTLSNESSNYLCATAGETLGGTNREIIGIIHLFSDKSIIFTTSQPVAGSPNAILHEIGLFEETVCRYRPIVQDNCLNFSRYNLISGASREREDCSWGVYWADGLNPDRYLNIGDPQLWPGRDFVWANNNTYANGATTMQWPGVQWVEDCNVDQLGCNICVDTTDLDCDAIRLARLTGTPCLTVSVGTQGGTLRNGSYFAVLAYTIKQQKVSDYFSPSNVQPIYIEDDFRGGLKIDIEADSENFDEFELVIVQTINQGTTARRIGYYSTRTTTVYIDQIKEDLVTVPLDQLPLKNPVYETSDMMEEVNNYLLRVGPRSKFDFNYQPLANLIRAKWANVEYPDDYYINGGSNTSYLRDENYVFFIRWIYNTGDRSSSYVIPGRAPRAVAGGFENSNYSDYNSLPDDTKYFETINTATTLATPGTALPDGGTVVATGDMGYMESTEIYPDDRPDIWNSSFHCWTGRYDQPSIDYDLCGQPIRLHKFPDNQKTGAAHFNGDNIRLMGVYFENIILPKDNDGNDIPGIVGYEILRGSREGNKTVIAKGMVNNMRPYNIQNNGNDRKGLYPNHPYNTITPVTTTGINDPFIIAIDDDDDKIDYEESDMPKDVITFHSPDLEFKRPLLSMTELKLYGHLQGTSRHEHIEPDQHPEHKLISNLTMFAGIIGGIIDVLLANLGKRTINAPGASFTRVFGDDYTQNANSGGSGTLTGTLTGVVPGVITGTQTGNWNAIGGNDGDTEIVEYSQDLPGEDGLSDFNDALNDYNTDFENYFQNGEAVDEGSGGIAGIITGGGNELYDVYTTFNEDGGLTPGGTYTAPGYNTEVSGHQLIKGNGFLGPLLTAAGEVLFYFSEGFETTLRIIYAILPYRQYALQQISVGKYTQYVQPLDSQNTPVRFKLDDHFYLNPTVQNMRDYVDSSSVPQKYTIANLKRSKTTVLRTTRGDGTTDGPRFIGSDNSLVTLGTLANSTGLDLTDSPQTRFERTVASHYAGVKLRIGNQYGQLDTVKQIPITPCEQKFVYDDIPVTTLPPACNIQFEQKIINETPVFFGGDTYVNKYTEKNTMFMFYDWLYGQPDGFQYNYLLYQMIPRPRFWMNSQRYEGMQLWNNITDFLLGNPTPGQGIFPTDYYQLDHTGGIGAAYNYPNDNLNDPPGVFGVKKSFFYLFNSGVREFYVESDIIVDFREQGAEPQQKVYQPHAYTDLFQMFNANPNIITYGNYMAYDYSLSISKLLTQYLSQGNLQSRFYDPTVAELCYTYYPDRILYSLPQQLESTKDNWFMYLVNNYKEFKAQISGVKNFAKTGIFITFKNASPQVFQGVDALQTDLGTKVLLGDGGLFANPPQNVVIADAEYEYGSSQDSLSVISTPAGMFYTSQNQGKIFSFSKGLQEISQLNLKWWFYKFLPFKLLEDFPDYPHTNNPVAGVGCQSIYDNKNSTLYFCKRDYRLRDEFRGRVEWNPELNLFVIDRVVRTNIDNRDVFEDASWTISFDPKSNFWVSFHDWHPDLLMASKDSFLSIRNNTIWKHNDICNDFCRFYGEDYPFEVEIPVITGQNVTTMKSIQYVLECYKRDDYNCVDQFHVLDHNFDQAVIHNSEQVSGYLNLNPYPKNNTPLNLEYPRINFDTIDILFSKEENKYRFNQFWDITRDRGEFPVGSNNPTTNPVIPGTTVQFGGKEERRIWQTAANGYVKTLNPDNLNYSKDPLQRKKFRHYNNLVFLRRNISGDTNMILKLTNVKNQISPR